MTPAFALVYKPEMTIRDLDAVRHQNEPYVLVRATSTPHVYVALSAHFVARTPPEGYAVIAFDGA